MEQIKPILLIRVNSIGMTIDKINTICENWAEKTGGQYHVVCLPDINVESTQIEVHSPNYTFKVKQDK